MSTITNFAAKIEDRDFTKGDLKYLGEFMKDCGMAMEYLADTMSDGDTARFNTDNIAEEVFDDAGEYAAQFLDDFDELPTGDYLWANVLAHKLLSRLVTITTSEA